MHGYCSFVYNILLIFLSLFFSLSFLCLCLSQVATNPPNYVHPNLLQIHPTPSNHQLITTTTTHHNSSQHMIFQSQNQPKTKENQTKNQPKPKIKPSTENSKTQNPKSNFQQKTHQPKSKCLRATVKEKIKKKKKMKRKDHGRGCRDEM